MSKYIFALALIFLTTNLCALENKPIKQKTSLIRDIYGKTPVDCIYLGMVTYHTEKRWRNRNDNWNNQAIGFQYNGIFLNTIINSHYKRCYTFGMTRDWVDYHPIKDIKVTCGYRLGGIYGYGAELNEFAAVCPVVPIYQLCSQIQYKFVRLEFSYFRKLFSAYLTICYEEF